jgi:hypothetical protein
MSHTKIAQNALIASPCSIASLGLGNENSDEAMREWVDAGSGSVPTHEVKPQDWAMLRAAAVWRLPSENWALAGK